jgi:hypothetical protein
MLIGMIQIAFYNASILPRNVIDRRIFCADGDYFARNLCANAQKWCAHGRNSLAFQVSSDLTVGIVRFIYRMLECVYHASFISDDRCEFYPGWGGIAGDGED